MELRDFLKLVESDTLIKILDKETNTFIRDIYFRDLTSPEIMLTSNRNAMHYKVSKVKVDKINDYGLMIIEIEKERGI